MKIPAPRLTRRNALTLMLLAALLTPAFAWAWQETPGIPHARGVTTGMGCFLQSNTMVHGGASEAITMTSRALTDGLTVKDGGACNTLSGPGITKSIRGFFTVSLLMLQKAGTGSARDTYFHCRTVQGGGASTWQSEVNHSVTFKTPPCGPGHYAEMSCFTGDTRVTGGDEGFIGSFLATNAKTQCNVSPFWHPAMNNPPANQGPPVKL